jgi:hypothetical protein
MKKAASGAADAIAGGGCLRHYARMSDPHLFWTIFGSVLGALLLAGMFFWGIAKYSRLEAEGQQGGRDGTTALVCIIMPLGFLGIAFFTALG